MLRWLIAARHSIISLCKRRRIETRASAKPLFSLASVSLLVLTSYKTYNERWRWDWRRNNNDDKNFVGYACQKLANIMGISLLFGKQPPVAAFECLYKVAHVNRCRSLSAAEMMYSHNSLPTENNSTARSTQQNRLIEDPYSTRQRGLPRREQ